MKSISIDLTYAENDFIKMYGCILCNISNNLENYRVPDDIDFVSIKNYQVSARSGAWRLVYCRVRLSLIHDSRGALIDRRGALNLSLRWGKKRGCGSGRGCAFTRMRERKKKEIKHLGFCTWVWGSLRGKCDRVRCIRLGKRRYTQTTKICFIMNHVNLFLWVNDLFTCIVTYNNNVQ